MRLRHTSFRPRIPDRRMCGVEDGFRYCERARPDLRRCSSGPHLKHRRSHQVEHDPRRHDYGGGDRGLGSTCLRSEISERGDTVLVFRVRLAALLQIPKSVSSRSRRDLSLARVVPGWRGRGLGELTALLDFRIFETPICFRYVSMGPNVTS